MKLTDDIADGARRLLVLRRRREAELRHRIDDAALHRLETVRDVRQRAIEDDVHRVVEVRLARELADGRLFDLEEVRRRGLWWSGLGLSGGHRYGDGMILAT